jgi:hypothetical protein
MTSTMTDLYSTGISGEIPIPITTRRWTKRLTSGRGADRIDIGPGRVDAGGGQG